MIKSALDASMPRETCRISSTGEALGDVLELTHGTGIRRFAAHHERLEPGRRASRPHAHSEKEELVYVLRGQPTLWLDGEKTTLREHDSVSFRAGAGVMHFLSNESDDVVEYLVVSAGSEADVITYAARGADGGTPHEATDSRTPTTGTDRAPPRPVGSSTLRWPMPEPAPVPVPVGQSR